jgi:putative transposase
MPRKRYKPEEIVGKLQQVDVLVSQGTSMADAIRPHASLGYKPPAPEVFMPAFTAWPAPPPRPAPPATLAQPPALN